ncbi:MAG: vacuolar iron transporter family protein, partial [Solirubrobacteraceae bacterium]|nr:vacuolar iron transporter family protein [Solirubrobacteraceae bacterium]
MTTDAAARKPVDHHVRHRDVTGGWLRPAVFGVMDGLVSNVALVVGVAAADATNRLV